MHKLLIFITVSVSLLLAGCGKEGLEGLFTGVAQLKAECEKANSHWWDSRDIPPACKRKPSRRSECKDEGGAWDSPSQCCLIVNFPPICWEPLHRELFWFHWADDSL